MPREERDFERLVGSLDTNAAPSPEHRDKLRQEMFAAYDRARQAGPRGWGVRAKWTLVGISALVAAGIVWLIAGGGGDFTFHSFADVLQNVQHATSVSYDASFEGPDLSPSARVALLGPHLLRHEDTSGKVWVVDFARGKGLRLWPSQRAGYLVPEDELLWRSDLDLLAHVRRLGAHDGRFVGRGSIDKQPAIVFRAHTPEVNVTLWVNPETDLPMRVELIGQDNANDAKSRWTATLTNFSWNAPMPGEQFGLEPPPGYALRDFDAQEATETDLHNSLWRYATLASGLFPEAFDKESAGALVFQARTKGSPATPAQRAAYRAILRGLRFARKLTQAGGEWHYSGAGVSLGDRSRVVCWWTLPGMSGYRGVLGDLTVGPLTASELPPPATRPTTSPSKPD